MGLLRAYNSWWPSPHCFGVLTNPTEARDAFTVGKERVVTSIVGSLLEISRFPVKSMQGESLEHADLDAVGVLGDRAYALLDTETGKVVSAKSVRLFPDLLACRAAFVESPQAGSEMPPVRITLPNGTEVVSGSSQTGRALSAYFQREVSLVQAAPENFTIDMYHPDIDGVDSAGHRDAFVEQKLGSALFAELGLPSPVPVGKLFDVFPMTVLTTSTLERLRELDSGSTFDPRRFRMNAVVKTTGVGFVENDWVEHELSIGAVLKLGVAMPDSRCVMTTLAQADLPHEPDVLRTLARHNRIQVGPAGRSPCAGVYAAVTAAGRIAVGDEVGLT